MNDENAYINKRQNNYLHNSEFAFSNFGCERRNGIFYETAPTSL